MKEVTEGLSVRQEKDWGGGGHIVTEEIGNRFVLQGDMQKD